MGLIIIKNARIVLEDKIVAGSLSIEDDRIVGVSCNPDNTTGSNVIDAKNNIIVPGFVDLHTHGAGDHDFMDGTVDDIVIAAKMELLHGTTTLLPTSLTSSDEDLFLFLDNFKKARKKNDILPFMPGVHLEGPYFDMIEKGAQDARYIKFPEKKHYSMILEKAEGLVSRWSLAPELPGAIDMLDNLRDSGILFSAGHTAATYDIISKACDHGVKLLTHFYSGMSSIIRKGGFRILGAIESGYLLEDLSVELICDGLHLPPDLLKMIFKCKNHNFITACTDSMRGAGMGNGPSILGPRKNGQDVIIEDGIAKMPDRTCFAGSVATGNKLLYTLTRIVGLTFPEASKIVSLQPAALISLADEIGSIKVGKKADLVILDDDCNVCNVIKSGKIV